MKKTLLTSLALILISSSAMATYNSPCQTCPPGPQGPQGIQGTSGAPGIDGTNGTNGVNGTNGTNGKDGTSYDNNKQRANIAGTMAMTRIDHAKNNGQSAGIGMSSFDGGEAMAIGIGKSFTSTGKIKEYVLDAAAYVGNSGSQTESGIAAGMTLHW